MFVVDCQRKESLKQGLKEGEAGFAVLSSIWNISVCKDLQRQCKSARCTLIFILD